MPTLITQNFLDTQQAKSENNKVESYTTDDLDDIKPESRTRPLRKAAINRRFRIVTSQSKSGTKKQTVDLISTDGDVLASNEVNAIEYGDENKVLTGDMVIGQMTKNQKWERLQKQKKGLRYHSAAVKLPFKQLVSENEAWRHGYCVPMLEPLLYKGPLCYLCGSGGIGELVYCMSCNEPFHPYCCEFSPTDHGQWYCSNCIVCDVCLTMDNLLECDQCHRHYHECCLSRDHPLGTDDDDEIWKCSRCVRCVSCRSVKAGQYEGARWHESFTLCEACALLKEKGNVCPVCQKCYQDFDFDSKMIQCALCERWIHAECADVSDDDYDALSLLPDSVAEFECKLCCPVSSTRWKAAILSDSLSGMRKVCMALKSQFDDLPIDLDSITSNVEMGYYSSSPTRFGHDVLKLLESLVNNPEEDLHMQKTAILVQDNFCKIMVKLFPWFSPENALQLEPQKCQEKKSEVDKMFTATPYPSSDHDYSNPTIPKSPPKTPEHRAFAGQRDISFSDFRRCVFCLEDGDSGPMEAGRLICVALDEWAHVNCCLWSAEVFERQDGTLQHLDKAIARGKSLKCDFCGRPGATTGCCDSRCRLSFHFICARKAGCLFLNNKQVFCTSHYVSGREQLSKEKLQVDRRVYVDLTKIRPSKQKLETLNHKTLKLRIGSMLVTAFGKLVDASDTSKTLLPVGFSSTRVFWSTTDVTKCCQYTCTVTIQGETSSQPNPQSKQKESVDTPLLQDTPSEVSKLLSMASHYNNVLPFSLQNSPMTSFETISRSKTQTEGPLKAQKQVLQGTKPNAVHVTKSNSLLKPSVKAVNLFPQYQTILTPVSNSGLPLTSKNHQIIQVVAVPIMSNVYKIMSIITPPPTLNNPSTYLPPILPKPANSDASKESPGLVPHPRSSVAPTVSPTVSQSEVSTVSQSEVSSSSNGTVSLLGLRHMQLETTKTVEMASKKDLSSNLEAGLSTSSVTTHPQPFGVRSQSAMLPVKTISGIEMVTSVSTATSQSKNVKKIHDIGEVTSRPPKMVAVSTEKHLTSVVGALKPAVVSTQSSLMSGCVGVATAQSDCLSTENTQKALKTKNLHSICQLLPLGSNELQLSNELDVAKQTKYVPKLVLHPKPTLNFGTSAPVCCGHVTDSKLSVTSAIARTLPVTSDHMTVNTPSLDVGVAKVTSKTGNKLNSSTVATGRQFPVSHDHETLLTSNSELAGKPIMQSQYKTTEENKAIPMDCVSLVFSKQSTADTAQSVDHVLLSEQQEQQQTDKVVTPSTPSTKVGVVVSSQSAMNKFLSVAPDHSSITKPLSAIPIQKAVAQPCLTQTVMSSKTIGVAMTSSVTAISHPAVSTLPTSHPQSHVSPLCQTWPSGMSMPNILRRTSVTHKKTLISTPPLSSTQVPSVPSVPTNSTHSSPVPLVNVFINSKPIEPPVVPNINPVSRPKRKQDHVMNNSETLVNIDVPENDNINVVNGGEPSWSAIDSWISASPVKKQRVTSRRRGATCESEFDIPGPPAPRSQQQMNEEGSKSGLDLDGRKLVFVVKSEDGFSAEASSSQEAWDAVICTVSEKRRDAGLSSISFAGIDGLLMFGLNQEFVVSVIEQLENSHLCSKYKFKYINPRPLRAFLPIDTEVTESPHGAARAEVYLRSCNLHLPIQLYV
jgi:hypothetical protein